MAQLASDMTRPARRLSGGSLRYCWLGVLKQADELGASPLKLAYTCRVVHDAVTSHCLGEDFPGCGKAAVAIDTTEAPVAATLLLLSRTDDSGRWVPRRPPLD